MNTIYTAVQQELAATYTAMPLHPNWPERWRRFVFFAATVQNILAIDEHSAQEALFRKVCYHQALSLWEDRYAHLITDVPLQGWDADFTDGLLAEPGIICTFHTGSYRLLNHLLIQAGVPFALVVSGAVKQRAAADFTKRYAQLNGSAGAFQVLDAEDTGILFRMKRMLQQGINLVVYLDGNTGPGEGGQPVPFFGQQVQARTGLAALAHWLKVPLYPVANSRFGDGFRFDFLPPIKNIAQESRQDFSLRVTGQLYAFLQEILCKEPAQWEGWLFLHHMLLQEERPGQNGILRLLPFELEGLAFALDTYSLVSYPLWPRDYTKMLNNYE